MLIHSSSQHYYGSYQRLIQIIEEVRRHSVKTGIMMSEEKPDYTSSLQSLPQHSSRNGCFRCDASSTAERVYRLGESRRDYIPSTFTVTYAIFIPTLWSMDNAKIHQKQDIMAKRQRAHKAALLVIHRYPFKVHQTVYQHPDQTYTIVSLYLHRYSINRDLL